MQFANSPFAFAESVKSQRSPASVWTAVGAHAIVLLALFALAAQHVTTFTKGTLLAPTIEPPPLTLPRALTSSGSGSSGAHDIAQAGLGHPPRMDPVQIVPPPIQPVVPAQLPTPPTVNVQMATNSMINLGITNAASTSVHVGVGKNGAVGDRDGTGGVGDHAGPGSGTGPYHAGTGGIHDPVLIHSVEAEFSDDARRHKFSGNVEVYLWVDESGNPSHIRVVRGAGMGLDENAVAAVRQYKFKPAMKDGKPVKVDMYIDVDFNIF